MAIKDARKERPPTAYAPLIGREYRLLRPLPYQAPTTTSTTSPRYSGNSSPTSKPLLSPHLASFSMRIPGLTPQSSGAHAWSMRCSQTWLQTPKEIEKKMTFSSMSYSTAKRIVLKERMHGWIRAEAC
jgi:hypothetical protein